MPEGMQSAGVSFDFNFVVGRFALLLVRAVCCVHQHLFVAKYPGGDDGSALLFAWS